MENEIWKDVVGYEGFYQVSNLGRVKSLGNNKFKKEKILKYGCNNRGYLMLSLYLDGVGKTRFIHKLVAESFLGHISKGHKIVIDHINDNSKDNRLENLQIITQRENAFKTQGKYSSKYKGVSWCKKNKKWKSGININGKTNYLGLFVVEHDAHLAYQNKLKELSK